MRQATKINYNEEGSISSVLAVAFGLLFVLTSIFAIWAFSERQSYKNDVDQKIEAANAVAVQEAETAKEAEFVEREKLPTITYTGPSVFGGISFSYPKTWSVYVEESNTGTVLDLFAHPRVLPAFKSDQPYALRLEVVSNSYDKEIESLNRFVERGEVKTEPLRPSKVNSVLGIKASGNFGDDRQSTVAYFPLRDRTIKIYTESSEFANDFNSIVLPSISFQP